MSALWGGFILMLLMAWFCFIGGLMGYCVAFW